MCHPLIRQNYGPSPDSEGAVYGAFSLCDRQRSSEQFGASEVGYGSEMKAIMVIAFAQLTMR